LIKYLFIAFIVLFFQACNENKTVNTKEILENNCASCHNTDMPPKIYEKELAPPLMSITFHLKDFTKQDNPSNDKSAFTSFVSSYILNPSKKKAFCDEESIKDMD